MDSQAAFMRLDLDKYDDKWVVLFEDKVIAVDKNAKTAFDNARKIEPKRKLFIFKAPGKSAMIL